MPARCQTSLLLVRLFQGKRIAHNQDEYMAVADLRTNLEIYLRSLQALTK